MNKLIAFGIDFLPILNVFGLDFKGFWDPKCVAQFSPGGLLEGSGGLLGPRWALGPSQMAPLPLQGPILIDF